MRVDPVTGLVLLAVAIGGGAVGWAVKPDQAAKVLEQQAAAIEAMQAGQVQLLEQAAAPVVIDAELRSQLADVPVQCLQELGGHPLGVQCQWATCLQYGQSAAQRPECSQVRDLLVRLLEQEGCPHADHAGQ